mgnify:CR=1 FL=1
MNEKKNLLDIFLFSSNRFGTRTIRRRTIRRVQFVANNSSHEQFVAEQFVAEQFVAFYSSHILYTLINKCE